LAWAPVPNCQRWSRGGRLAVLAGDHAVNQPVIYLYLDRFRGRALKLEGDETNTLPRRI